MFQASYLTNVKFQVEKLEKSVNEQDLQQDIQKFIEANKSNKPLFKLMPYEQFVSFVDCSMERIKENQNSKFDSQSELMIKKSIEEGQLVHESESNEFNDKIKYVLDLTIKAWNDYNLTHEQFQEYHSKTLEDVDYSKIFAHIMQQFRIQNKFQLTTAGFQSITILLNCALSGVIILIYLFI